MIHSPVPAATGASVTPNQWSLPKPLQHPSAATSKAVMQLPLCWEQALPEQKALSEALATSRRNLQAAREQIEALLQNDLRLRRKLIRIARKAQEARHSAYHDELTGLPNRSLLLDRLKQAMKQAARQHKHVALLLLDLDGFKSVNDGLGHSAGDELLKQVAARLTACIRGGDTACRYGGDEFVVMLPEIEGQESAAAVIEKIRAHLEAPYRIAGEVVRITASIGSAMYKAGEQHPSDLIKRADIAMYAAKACISSATTFGKQTRQTQSVVA